MTLAHSMIDRHGRTFGEATVTSLDGVLSNLRVRVDRNVCKGGVEVAIEVNGATPILRVYVAEGSVSGCDMAHEVSYHHRDKVEFSWTVLTR